MSGSYSWSRGEVICMQYWEVHSCVWDFLTSLFHFQQSPHILMMTQYVWLPPSSASLYLQGLAFLILSLIPTKLGFMSFSFEPLSPRTFYVAAILPVAF